MNTAHEFFLHELGNLYNAERRLLAVLQAAEESSKRGDLKRAFGRHRRQTATHIQRLDGVFQSLGEQPHEEPCEGLEGLVREQKSTAEKALAEELRDLDLALAGIKIERYEIAGYEGLIFLAQKMGHREAVSRLRETLRDEQESAKLLTELMKATKLDWEAGMRPEAGEAAPSRPRRRAA